MIVLHRNDGNAVRVKGSSIQSYVGGHQNGTRIMYGGWQRPDISYVTETPEEIDFLIASDRDEIPSIGLAHLAGIICANGTTPGESIEKAQQILDMIALSKEVA